MGIHAAAEVALPMLILLKPEAEAHEEPRERRELAKIERQYRKATGPFASAPSGVATRPPPARRPIPKRPRRAAQERRRSERCDSRLWLRFDSADRAGSFRNRPAQ